MSTESAQPRSGSSSGSVSPSSGGRSRSGSIGTSPASANSSLAASLKAFADLSLAKPTSLDSAEFQQALGHARRASITSPVVGPTAPVAPQPKAVVIPGLSASPTLSAADTELPTPGSSPISLIPATKPAKKAPSLTGVQLDGVCERAELVEGDDVDLLSPVSPSEMPTSPLSGSSSLFSGGARWGWPQSAKHAGGSSPPPPAVGPLSASAPLGRRASITGPAPAASAGAPLGRVTSAGGTTSSASKDGLGLFRRFSVGGFGSRPKPPSPPASTLNVPQVPVSASAPPAADEGRGRRTVSGGAKPKRKISPMGERMLRGF